MQKLDNGAISFIKSLDSRGFLEYINRKQATICGAVPIAILTELMKGKAKKVNLMQYYTSADIIGDYNNAVGYASIVFK